MRTDAELRKKDDAAPVPGRWYRPPEPRRDLRPTVHYAFPLGVLGLTVPLFAAMLRGGAFDPGTVAFGFVWLGLAVAWSAYAHWSALLADRRDVQLLEDRDDADVGLVQIAIVRDGRTIGRDRGVAWFADGRLLFGGHATSFALGGEDVLPPQERHGPYREFYRENTRRPALPEATIPLRLADGWAYVVFEPLRVGDLQSHLEDKRDFRFLKAFAAFRRNPPGSTGPRQCRR